MCAKLYVSYVSICHGCLSTSALVKPGFNTADFTFSANNDTFAGLFLLSSTTPAAAVADQQSETQAAPKITAELPAAEACADNVPVYHHLPMQRPGPQPLHQQFPHLVTFVTQFMQTHGFSAQS